MFRGVLAGGGTLHVSLCLRPASGTLLDTSVLLPSIHPPYPGSGPWSSFEDSLSPDSTATLNASSATDVGARSEADELDSPGM